MVCCVTTIHHHEATMSHERAQNLLREAAIVLTHCQEDIENGRNVDITPMTNVVQEFCQILHTLPKPEAQLYQEPLIVMMEGLQAMETMLLHKRDTLKEQASQLNHNAAAQNAYRKNATILTSE
jgi:hypothetical protein